MYSDVYITNRYYAIYKLYVYIHLSRFLTMDRKETRSPVQLENSGPGNFVLVNGAWMGCCIKCGNQQPHSFASVKASQYGECV